MIKSVGVHFMISQPFVAQITVYGGLEKLGLPFAFSPGKWGAA